MNILDEINDRLVRIEAALDALLRHQQVQAGRRKPDDWGGIEMAESMLGLTSNAIYKHTGQRAKPPVIPHVKRHGRLFFHRPALRAYIDSGCHGETPLRKAA